MNTPAAFEQLWLAAKAAGIEVGNEAPGGGLFVRVVSQGSVPMFVVWDPLSDDGDALRLAAAIAPRAPGGVLCLSIGISTSCEFNYAHGPDAADNTRRAIVTAAAKIGAALTQREERRQQQRAAHASCIKGADCTVATGYCSGCCS